MKKITPIQMTDDLAHFIAETREDVAFPHESLYVDLLVQWKALSNYNLKWADDTSRELYDIYWSSMRKWYEIFDQQRAKLLEPAAMPSVELVDFYAGLIDDLSCHVLSVIPDYPHAGVIDLTDFRVLLNIQLQNFTALNLRVQGPMDFAMLIDYWKLMNEAFGQVDKKVS
jgi:hypothetical protein